MGQDRLENKEWQQRFAGAFYEELIVNSADNPWGECSEETRQSWVAAVFRALKRTERTDLGRPISPDNVFHAGADDGGMPPVPDGAKGTIQMLTAADVEANRKP